MLRHLILSALICLGWPIVSPAQNPKEAQQRSITDLVADLKKGEKERLRALEELELRGAKAAEAAPALVDLLSIKDEFTRLQTAIVLGKIGKAAVEPLTRVLASPDEAVRFYAVWGLAFVGPQAKTAESAVIKALKDKSAQVRRKAAYALGRIDPDAEEAATALVGALEDKDEDVRQAAAASLPRIGKRAVPVLTKALHSDKANLRNLAIKTLGDIGAGAESVVSELKPFLLQPDKGAAELTANALAGIGASALPTLNEAAANDSSAVRSLALGALQKIGPPAAPALVDLLGAKHKDVRRLAASLLGNMRVQDKMVVIGLGYALKDKDMEVRRNALHSLRNLGSGAKLAEPYVSALLVDLDPGLRREAFYTLQNLGVDTRAGLKKALGHQDAAIRIPTASLMAELNFEIDLAEPVLLEGLKEKNKALRMQAAHALALRGRKAAEVLPIFIDGLKNDLASVRLQAAEAIARYGEKGRNAEPVLLGALDDPDDSVRLQVLRTLRQVSEPKTLLPAMIKVLKQKESNLHTEAAEVVFQVGPGTVDELVELLKTEKAPALRLVCVQTLAMLGPPAKGAVGELIKALDDPAPRVRMNAARALGNIGPEAKPAEVALMRAKKDADGNVQKLALAALAQLRADPGKQTFEVQGVLTPGDPFDRVRQGSYHVVHTYAMKAGKTYTIDLISTWDNFLRLENAQGQQLAQDDDSGGFPNARIVFQAPKDGWYRIIVTSFAPRASGNYTLKVR
jgi:HEAT repeat protein